MSKCIIGTVLAVVLCSTMAAATLPACTNGQYLALMSEGELLPSLSLSYALDQGIAAIKSEYPEMADIDVFKPWFAGKLNVALTEEAFDDYVAGAPSAVDSLNSVYGVSSVILREEDNALRIEFTQPYHPIVLAAIYETANGVRYAGPSFIGGDGNTISWEEFPYYTFRRAWGDCMSGCIYEEIWEFQVIGGDAELIAHVGVDDEDLQVAPMSIQATPNPFNARVSIRFISAQLGPVHLRIHDLKGRPIAELVNEVRPAGVHEVAWDGRNHEGAKVASGTYVARLIADGRPSTTRMTLLK